MEGAPVIPVSVYEKQGMDVLKKVLKEQCDSLAERDDAGHFRLPIDRIFTLKGFGTIVTGTLMEGRIKKDQEVILYPENAPVKVRSIQVHSENADTALAGQRVAVNIPDRKKDEILRGDVLASKNSLFPTRMLDVKVEVLKHTDRLIRNGSRVHVYVGTKELLGKIILMDREELKAGESGYAQLRLEEETAVRKGDRFVLRFYSPVETLGGGIILDSCPGKHRRNDQKALKAFQIKENGSQEELLELSALEHQRCFYSLAELTARSSLDRSKVKNIAKKLAEENKLIAVSDQVYIHKEEMEGYSGNVIHFLDEFHKSYPLKEGMGIEEVRSRMNLGKNGSYADALLGIIKQEKLIKEQDGCISKYRFKVVVREDEDVIMREIIQYYQDVGFAPLTTELYTKEHRSQKKFKAVFTSLLNKKILIRLDGQYCIHRDHYEKAQIAIKELAEQKNFVILGEFRDYLGCSRRMAVAILEYFDKSGYTRKKEEGRVLKSV